MEPSRLKYLFNVYYNKTASSEERIEFLDFVAESEQDEDLKALLTEKWLSLQNEKEILTVGQVDEMLTAILEKQPIKTNRLMRMSVAAAIFLITGMSIYICFKPGRLTLQSAQLIKKENTDKIVQGGKKAVLTLGDGSKLP